MKHSKKGFRILIAYEEWQCITGPLETPPNYKKIHLIKCVRGRTSLSTCKKLAKKFGPQIDISILEYKGTRDWNIYHYNGDTIDFVCTQYNNEDFDKWCI